MSIPLTTHRFAIGILQDDIRRREEMPISSGGKTARALVAVRCTISPKAGVAITRVTPMWRSTFAPGLV